MLLPGECYLDPSVARVIRDTACDCITLKVGINPLCVAAFNRRTVIITCAYYYSCNMYCC